MNDYQKLPEETDINRQVQMMLDKIAYEERPYRGGLIAKLYEFSLRDVGINAFLHRFFRGEFSSFENMLVELCCYLAMQKSILQKDLEEAMKW